MTAPSREIETRTGAQEGDGASFGPWRLPAWVDGQPPGARIVGGMAAIALVATYLLTWSLWQTRADPPNLLGMAGLRDINFAWPLILTALLAIRLPRLGSVSHAALLTLAIGGDQLRLQPEFVFLATMLVASAWPMPGIQVVRWQLIGLWFWSGLHKALSGGWPTDGAGFIAGSIGLSGTRGVVAYVVPVAEIGLAVLALWPRAWRVLVIASPTFHIGVVLVLAAASSNTAVWPWNLAIAASVPFVFRDDESTSGMRFYRASSWVPAAVFLLLPIGFYFGTFDAYLSFDVYSVNTASATVCEHHHGTERCQPEPLSTWARLNVPIPPERRLFVAWFEQTCRPGETLRIDGIWTRFAERQVSRAECPS
jgi:hypothetical protein